MHINHSYSGLPYCLTFLQLLHASSVLLFITTVIIIIIYFNQYYHQHQAVVQRVKRKRAKVQAGKSCKYLLRAQLREGSLRVTKQASGNSLSANQGYLQRATSLNAKLKHYHVRSEAVYAAECSSMHGKDLRRNWKSSFQKRKPRGSDSVR